MESLKQQIDEYKNKYLRALADYQIWKKLAMKDLN